jgi:DMSO/TMAO reductase YedYZ molybdopterin-dependent catalytic subunit
VSLLRFLTREPPNAGTPLRLLDGRPLGADEVYLRNNFSIPHNPGRDVAVRFDGRHFNFDTDDLAGLPQIAVEMVLECAGNGRTHMSPVPEGTPWDLGGASPVIFGGVALLEVIGEPGPGTNELIFRGADQGLVEPEGIVNYEFSLGRESWSRSILATHLGGAPLTTEHGGPIRLVVPGKYAMKSVKWVESIVGTDRPFEGHFVAKYRYFDDTLEPEGAPVSDIQVRSVISNPGDGATVPPGEVGIEGSAWSGGGPVTRIELKVDDQDWAPAELTAGTSEFGAVAWRWNTTLAPGPHTASARAFDTSGRTQPTASRWNANGYGNNVVHSVRFEVG